MSSVGLNVGKWVVWGLVVMVEGEMVITSGAMAGWVRAVECDSWRDSRYCLLRTNTGSIQCTLDVILALFLILVVRVIDGLQPCDSRFSGGRVTVRMKCIYERARDRGTLAAYRKGPGGCGRPGGLAG
eukprot:scaffold108633_cov30-Attheya_sp.AAC.1